MLLVADRYGVALLRDHCLHGLAARFEALVEERAPPREREVFEAFVAAVAPQVPAHPASAPPAAPVGASALPLCGKPAQEPSHMFSITVEQS